jgi:CelD/BcsL family acetyltransferase involved in cellulose biosynthesis
VSAPDADIVEKGGQPGMQDRWVPRQIALEFRLGNLCLFSKSIAGKELFVHFSQLDNNPDAVFPQIGELFSVFQAALICAQPVTGKPSRLKFLPGMIRYIPAIYRRFSIDLQGSFEDYLNKFSSKSRKNLAREVRRFSEFCGGTLDWREYRGSHDAEEFYRQAREVSKKSWQEKHQDVGFPESDEFRAEMTDLASRDAIRGYILFHQKQPIAYAYCDVEDGALVYGYVGYDMEFERWSPGTVLLYQIIQKQFTERAFPLFDLGGREDWYKEFFSTRSTLCADVLYFRRSAGTFLVLLLHLGLSSLNRAASRVLEILGLKTLVRKLLRRKIPAHAIAQNRKGLSF